MNIPANSMQKIDCLIIGQGLAGSVLAWSLLQLGKKVHVIDNSHEHSSSIAAAGLVNPVTGKRLLKADDTEQCLETAIKLYRELAAFFNHDFYHPVEMIRLFTDRAQAGLLQQRLDSSDYAGYFGKLIDRRQNLKNLMLSEGGVYQHKTGYLDIPLLLNDLKNHFRQLNILHSQRLAHQDLFINRAGVNWQGLDADYCIFCEGYQAQDNPWFDWLPFQLAKGEILTLQSEQIDDSHIINRGNWLIPLKGHNFKTGSTNSWQFDDDQATTEGRQQIEKSLGNLFSPPPAYRVTEHKAGIRPATRDKKPFIGLHPELNRLGVFNGFGARGSMTIPYYARLFIQLLLDNNELPAAVDIQRYYPV